MCDEGLSSDQTQPAKDKSWGWGRGRVTLRNSPGSEVSWESARKLLRSSSWVCVSSAAASAWRASCQSSCLPKILFWLFPPPLPLAGVVFLKKHIWKNRSRTVPGHQSATTNCYDMPRESLSRHAAIAPGEMHWCRETGGHIALHRYACWANSAN